MYINNLITGTMTLGSGSSTPTGHSDTRVTYAEIYGIEDWTGEIIGELSESSIPTVEAAVTIDVGNTVTSIEADTFKYNSGWLTSLKFQGKTL